MGSLLDLATRTWWRAVGRSVDPQGEHAWLNAPVSGSSAIRDGWLPDALDALAPGGKILDAVDGAGLLPSLAVLDGPGFEASRLHPAVRDFYEHTADWRMEVWTAWRPLFWPAGEAISRLFGKRVGQLAIPTRVMDVARGMDSRVSIIVDESERQVAAAWLRTLRATGEYVYAGCYGSRLLPGADRPSVHVTFPLESGNVQVFLRPEVGPDGSLRLLSPGRGSDAGFGGHGAYVVVRDGGRTFAARVPLNERFDVYVDDDGVLRCDHELRLGPAEVVRLHYRLDRQN